MIKQFLINKALLVKGLLLENLVYAGLVLCALVLIELIFRLIPTKKPINLLALVARLLAKAAMLLRRLGNILPENRR